jgi:lysophospholipase L1-like esterase
MNVRGERILIFGDSLTQHASGQNPIWNVDQGPQRTHPAPGDLLASLLLDQGAAAVRTNALVSRSAVNFWTREPAASLIAADLAWRPTKIVFVLGTNDVGIPAAGDAAGFQRLYDAYKPSGAELWAIGPFTSRLPAAGVDQVVATMRKVFGSRFLDGRPLSKMISPGSDGVHYTPQAARLLALSMAQALIAASPVKPWMGIAIGAAVVIGGALIYGLAQRRSQLRGLEIVDGKRWGGSTAELVRGGYRQTPCKSGLDAKGIARCWTRGRSPRALAAPADPDDQEPGEDDEKWWERLQRQANAGRDRMREALEKHDAVILTTAGGRRVLVIKTPEVVDVEDGALRVTTFDEDGPIGHTTRPTIAKLAEEVHRDWHPQRIEPASEADIMAWTGTERFARGAAAVAEVQRFNRGLKGPPQKLRLWRKEGSGEGTDWIAERDVTPETAEQWLQVFRRDEPEAEFVVASRKPPTPRRRGKLIRGPGSEY